MVALERRKREWEQQNEQRWLRIVEASATTAKESVDRAGIVMSFLLFIALKAVSGIGALGRLVWLGHRPVIRLGPNGETCELCEQYRALHQAQPFSPYLRH